MSKSILIAANPSKSGNCRVARNITVIYPGFSSSTDTETTIMVSAVRDEMLAVMPQLRAFAVALCRSRDHADELVQETLLRACDNITKFEPGTNMTAWLITILRHQFYSEYRKRRRNGYYVKTMVTRPHQICHTEYRELLEAIAKLPKRVLSNTKLHEPTR
jgi:DNA-directed RNA polymerase specialized sigma24 family protein